MLEKENLTIDRSFHNLTPSNVANDNDFEKSSSSHHSLLTIKSTISTLTTDIQSLQMDYESNTVSKSPNIQVRGISMTNDCAGNDEFSNVIVNIIDDEGNLDTRNLPDEDGIWMETKDGAFSSSSPGSRSPRSKSSSLNSDQIISQLR